MTVLNYVFNRLIRRPGPMLTLGLIVAVSVATVLVAASTTMSLRKAQSDSAHALSSLGADIVAVRQAAPDDEGVAVADLPNGTHTRRLSRFRKASEDTSVTMIDSFASLGVPVALGGTLTTEEVTAVESIDGVSHAKGVLLASYCSIHQTQKKVVIDKQDIQPARFALDPKEEARLEKRVEADTVYNKLAREQQELLAKPEQSLTAADNKRIDELAGLLGERKLALYREWRPDIFTQAPKRAQKVVDPPAPTVRSEEYSVCGVAEGAGYLDAGDITQGRNLNNGDHARVAVLRRDFANSKGLAPGDTIDLLGVTYSVVGVGTPSLGSAAPEVYVPLEALQHDIDAEGVVNTLFIKLEPGADSRAVRGQLSKAVPDIRLSEDSDLRSALTPSLTGAARIVGKVGSVLALSLVAIAMLGVVVLSGTTTAKRSREMATLRAMGWTTKAVVGCMAIEGVAAVVIGTVAGSATGAYLLGLLAAPGDTAAYRMYSSARLFGLLAGMDTSTSLGSTVAITASAESVALALGTSVILCGLAIVAAAVRVTRTSPSAVLSGTR